MGKLLNKIIDRHIQDKENFTLVTQISFIYIFSMIGIIVTFSFGIKNVLIGNLVIGYVEIIVTLMQIANMYYFIRKNNILVVANILNLLLYILLTGLMVSGGLENTGIFWIFLFPMIVYFIDNKFSKYWIVLFATTIITVAILNNYQIIDTPYAFIEYRQALIAFLTISMLVHFYYNIIVSQREQLIQSRKDYQEQAQKAKASNRAKSEFLANMSHEVRTPLNAIMGFIDLLKEKEEDKEKLKYLKTIASSSQTLLEILNDILDISKIENRKLEIVNANFDTQKELTITKNLFVARCEEKSIILHSDYKSIPDFLNGDILRIKQVIHNLLSNAVKFTPENKNIYVMISYENGLLNTSVKDEGIGISKEYLNSIFEAFSQEDSSTTKNFGGTGLGLAISYNLIKLMGGELKVESEQKVGSEFYFSIPLKEGRNIQVKKSTKLQKQFNGHILQVEDNRSNQMLMNILLKKLNLTYDVANDGVEALEMFKVNKYDLILMDENMPNMNGIEATKQILEYENIHCLEHTPIVAVTANALKGDKDRFLNAGMDYYLTKPVNKNKLHEVINEILI